MILTSRLESKGREHHQETPQETGPCFAAAVGECPANIALWVVGGGGIRNRGGIVVDRFYSSRSGGEFVGIQPGRTTHFD